MRVVSIDLSLSFIIIIIINIIIIIITIIIIVIIIIIVRKVRNLNELYIVQKLYRFRKGKLKGVVNDCLIRLALRELIIV